MEASIASASPLVLDLLPGEFAVARFGPEAELPDWLLSSSFFSVTRTKGELSVVCCESSLPFSVEAERGFRCLGVRGPLSFSETGILASLATTLAAAGIGIFVVSTYDTDYLLVTAKSLDRTLGALDKAGHTVIGSVRGGSGPGAPR